MATLAGTKVKDKYGNLLQVNGGVDGTLSTVEDGNGNTSALKLSSTEVQLPSTGTKFSGVPAGSSTELTMLMLNGSNQVVRRTIDSSLSGDINFDSGWQDLQRTAESEGTYYGLNYATDAEINRGLQYRVINRTVYLKGDLYIPLDADGTSGTGALATTVAENQLYNRNTVHTASGWTASGGEVVSPHIFNADTLSLNMTEQDLRMWIPYQRTITETSDATGDTIGYCTFGCITIDSDFKLRLRSFYYYSSGDNHVINPIVELLPRFRSGAPFLSYDNYYTDASGTSADSRTVEAHDVNAAIDFDGRGVSDATHGAGNGVKGWGGLRVTLDGLQFQLDSSNTIDAISSVLSSQ